MRQFLQ
jgi:hypothetical protein